MTNIIYININQSPVILVDGLTLDDIKAKFSWILNAETENAIIGTQNNLITWYSGDWLDGDWYNGYWYSGTWHQGLWEQGTFDSITFDQNQLFSGKLVITDRNLNYSQFLSGTWETGTFINGTFGTSGNTNVNTIWENGIFQNGLFINSQWYTGTWQNGNFQNSVWSGGSFFNGTFDGYNWYTGNFFGGDFISGNWYTGEFNQIHPKILARFGASTDNTSICNWYNGNFRKGQFMSGFVLDNIGNTLPSTNQTLSTWYNGYWYNGSWYGGTFLDGKWYNGLWYGGIWGTWATNYESPNYIIYSSSTWNQLLNINDTNYATNLLSNIINNGVYGILVFSGFTFNVDPTANICGINLQIVRSGFYENILSMGQTQDYIVSIEGDSSNITPNFYNGSFTSFSCSSYVTNDYYSFNATGSSHGSYYINSGLFNLNSNDILLINIETFQFSSSVISSILIYWSGSSSATQFIGSIIIGSGTYFNQSQYIIPNITGLGYLIFEYLITNIPIIFSQNISIIKLLNLSNSNPFSYNNSFNVETINYGGYQNYVGLSGLNYSNINDLKVHYITQSTTSSKASYNFTVESRLYDLNLKIYNQTYPTWVNGTWYNGLWINGTFEDGTFIGGTWINGNING